MKLEGEIGEINLIERLVELGREQFTGAIRFENDGIIKIIYFKGGDILSASTNDRADSIDEILMRANKVSRDHVKQALAKRKESETLGDALLGLGFITKKELSWARRVQVIGVIRSIAAWTGGSYTIVADYLPKREEGTLFPLPQIVTELIVTDTDRAKFDAALEGGTATFTKAPDFDEAFRRLGLNQEAAAIMNNVDGTNSASEIAMLSGTDTFNVYKLLHALHVLGLLVTTQKPQVASEDFSAASAGGSNFDFGGDAVSDAADMGWGEPGAGATGLDFGTPEPLAGMPDPVGSFDTGFDAVPAAPAAPVQDSDLGLSLEDETPMGLPSLDLESEPEPPEIAMPRATAAALPSWDKPVAPAPPPIAPMQPFLDKSKRAAAPEPKPAKEEEWGFDEAQIETARKAAVPVRGKTPPPMKSVVAKASKPGKLIPILFAAVGIVIVGVGGMAAWNWWQNKQAAASAPVVTTRPVKHPVLHPVPPPATATTTTTATAATTTVAASTTTAPKPATSTATTTVASKPAPPPSVVPATTTVARVEKTPSGSTITNTTAKTPVPPATDADRQRYEAMAREFAADKSGNFTVQFELVCEAASITRALREGGTNVWFLPITYHNRSCYRVFWGRYATQEQAQAAANAIPQSLREAKPVVVHIPR